MATSRERVLSALNHREPSGFRSTSGYRSSGISAIAYPKLRAALGLPPRPSTSTIRSSNWPSSMTTCSMAGVDTIELGRGFCHEDKWWADWTLPDGTPCQMPVWAMPERANGEWVISLAERPRDGAHA